MRDSYFKRDILARLVEPVGYRVKLNEKLYFVSFDELQVRSISDDGPGFIEYSTVFKQLEDAQTVARHVGGVVVEVEEAEWTKSKS